MALLLRLFILIIRPVLTLIAMYVLWSFFTRILRPGAQRYEYRRTQPPGGSQRPSSSESPRSPKDPYAVLGCSPSASDEEIRKCYREMLGRYHPDKFIGQKLDPEFIRLAERKFQEIQEAYETLRRRRSF